MRQPETVPMACDQQTATVGPAKRWQGQDISGLTGEHLIYTYENGWVYELYVKNATTIDYRIHSGPVGGRWVKNQPVNAIQLSGKDRYKVNWMEPTGTAVSLVVNLETRQHHGVVFFPQWVHQHGIKTAMFQNDHLDQMMRLRNAGPTYPIFVVDEFAEMILVERRGVNNENVVNVSPQEFAPTLARICAANRLTHKFGQKWGPRDTSDLVGKRLNFTYANGWHHELYVRSASSIDYRIHSGLGALRSEKNQTAYIVRLTGSNRYIISSTEVTGTSMSLTLDLDIRELHAAIFFPQWILNDPLELIRSPSKSHERSSPVSVLRKEDSIEYCDAGPIYPLHLMSEFADITSIEDCAAEHATS
ncbi:hypothetical protein Mapa_012024 [Marchantia paleacea]|nr:hypothetical protein Mapa_012024 [Marchantia paleacea]